MVMAMMSSNTHVRFCSLQLLQREGPCCEHAVEHVHVHCDFTCCSCSSAPHVHLTLLFSEVEGFAFSECPGFVAIPLSLARLPHRPLALSPPSRDRNKRI